MVKPLSLFAGICSSSLQKHTFSEEKPPTPVESLYRILFYNMQSYSLDDLTNSRPPSRVSLYLLNVYHKIYYIVKLQYSLPKWKIWKIYFFARIYVLGTNIVIKTTFS